MTRRFSSGRSSSAARERVAHRLALLALDEELHAERVLDLRQRRGRRADHLAVGMVVARPLHQVVRVGHRALERLALDHDVDERDRRRIPQAGAELHFARVEHLVVLRRRGPDGVVVRIERLDDGLARRFAAPARPTTCVSNWNVRSAARKSARPRPTSADTTPTSVTDGKSCPFAIICVPTRMSMSPAPDGLEHARRSRRAAGSCPDPRGPRARRETARADRPRAVRCRTPPARDTRPRRRRICAARRRRSCSSGTAPAGARLWNVSDTLQCGHSIDAPHCRQNTTMAKPRRFSSTTVCSPRLSRSSNGLDQRPAQGHVRAGLRVFARAC